MPLRLGIIGSRFSASIQVRAAQAVDSIEIVAVAALDFERVQAFAALHGIANCFRSAGDLIECPEVDAICVCTPTSTHSSLIIEAALAQKHVICEKPLATTVEDAAAAIAACHEHGVVLCYAEDWLFAPSLIRAREIVDEGAIGRLVAIRAREAHSGSHSPYAQKIETCGGGAMLHLGAHPIAAARWFARSEVASVTMELTNGMSDNLLHRELEGDDWGVALLRFENGIRATIEANYVTMGGRNDVVELLGSTGYLNVDLTQGSPLRAFSLSGVGYAIEKADTTVGWSCPAINELVEHGFVEQMRVFSECIQSLRPPPFGTTGEDGLAVLKVALHR